MTREIAMVLIGMSIPFIIQGLTGFSIGAFLGQKFIDFIEKRKPR